jgi:hypothetical protein
MLSDVMEHFGLSQSLRQAGYFETDHHRQLLRDLKAPSTKAASSR